jgi:hypothetical protein
LPTWAAALGFEKQDRDYLGRWLPQESDEYLRNVSEVVGRIQHAVATKLRTKLGGGALHETEMFQELMTYALKRGYEEPDVCKMVEQMEHRGFNTAEVHAISDDEGHDGQGDARPFPEDFDKELPVDPAETRANRPDSELVLSTDAAGKTMTLHKVGACWRVPGIHYRRFRTVSSEKDLEAGCGVLCKECWPKSRNLTDVARPCDESSASSTSSDDSSNGE